MRDRKRVVRAIRIGWWIAAVLPIAALQAQVPDACPAGEVTVAGRDNAGEAWRPDGIVTPSRDLGLPDPAVHDAVRAQRQAAFARILLERPSALAPFEAPVSAAERASVAQGARDDALRYKVGVAAPVGLDVAFADSPASLPGGGVVVAQGRLVAVAGNARAWEVALHSEGATALRVQFAEVALAAGVELFVYNDGGQVLGPYTGSGPDAGASFWSDVTFGDQARVFLRAPDAAALAASRLRIEALMHMGTRFTLADVLRREHGRPGEADDRDFCGTTVVDCAINATCASGTGALANAMRAYGQYNFVSGGSAYICSGALLNDSDASTFVPYFLTANHCISTQAEASSISVRFDLRTATCGSCALLPTLAVNGSTLLATGAAPSAPDFTLLRLSSMPGGRYLLGWTSAAPPDATKLYRFSHPHGSPLAYSTRRVRIGASALPQCSGVPQPQFLYSGLGVADTDWSGATEGGSSGSPAFALVGGDYIVVGQLYGACHFGETSTPCDAANEATVDGALQASYPAMRRWLYDVIFRNGFN